MSGCWIIDNYSPGTYGEQEMENIRKEQLDTYIAQLETVLRDNNQDEEIKNMSDNQKEWLHKVENLLVEKKYDLAEQLFYGIFQSDNGNINLYWLNTESAVLNWMFQVYRAENESGVPPIFDHLCHIDEMPEFYYKLKFLVRRFEFDFPIEWKKDLLDFIAKGNVSAQALIQMVEASVVHKTKVYNELIAFFTEHGKEEYRIPLLMASFQTQDLAGDEVTQQMSLRVPEQEETIAFIICVNKEWFYEECCKYIKQLEVPEGYRVEIIPIYNARSMTSGYQMGMKQTNAKYKIYLHQDVMCIYKNMLFETLHIFEQDESIGLLGVAGCKVMPVSGVWWEAEAETSYYNLYQDLIVEMDGRNDEPGVTKYQNKYYQQVMALDGVFLMTSHDVDWREDMFTGWHMYDVSQSMEFLRKGYKVIIPKTENIWILHDEKYHTHLDSGYHRSRLDYLKEYRKELTNEKYFEFI